MKSECDPRQTMQTIAAVAREAGAALTLEAAATPPLEASDILVRIQAAGVCHTDLLAHSGKLPVRYPVVLGHEGFGNVLAVGRAVSTVVPGDTVILSFASCGACNHCAADSPGYCEHFAALNMSGWGGSRSRTLHTSSGPVGAGFFGQSSFSTHVVCGQANAVKVSSALPARLLAPLGCGVMTGAGTVMNTFAFPPGASLLVAGAGAVGLSAIMTARALGAGRIIAIEKNPIRQKLALLLGADVAIDASRDGPWTAAANAQAAAGVDFAIDTTGVGSVIEQLVLVLARRGTCALVGASAPGSNVQIEARHLMSGGRIVRGVVEGDARPQELVPKLVGMVEAGQLRLDEIVTSYPLESINRAFSDAATGLVVKPVICMGDERVASSRSTP